MDGRAWLDEAERACARGDRLGGLHAVEQVLASGVKLGAEWAVPTMMAHELGDADMAARAATRLCGEDGSDIRQWRLLASALEQIGKAQEAAAIHRKLLADNPDDVELNFEAGHTLKLLGDFASAEDRFRKVVSLDKSHWRGWEHLASVHRFSKGDEDLIALETRRVENIEGGGDKVQQADLAYALAKAYDDLGEYDLVGRRVEEAAAIAREKAPYDADAYHRRVKALIERYTPDLVARHADQGLADARPVFVLGPPRSGTTLVEAIVGAHPDAEPGGEHKLLWLSFLSLEEGADGDPERYASEAGQPDPWAALGARYVSRVEARIGHAKRWTDKNLYNNQRLGAAALALPAARFIWCRRDPMDIAWSAYRTRFGEGNLWTYSPDGIAAFLNDYDALMEHWVSVFPDRILEVRYEDLVRQPDVEIPRLLAFVGLSDDPATRNFHEADRAIATASLAQVRQPINTASIGAWKRYMPQIAALPEALEKAGIGFAR